MFCNLHSVFAQKFNKNNNITGFIIFTGRDKETKDMIKDCIHVYNSVVVANYLHYIF